MFARKLSSLAVQLCRDESGKVVSAELIVLLLLVAGGLVVGAVAVRNAMVAELGDGASAVGSMNQSFSADGLSVSFDNQNGATVTSTAPRHEGQ